MNIRKKAFWNTDTRINNKILNNGKIFKSFGLDAGWGVYRDFREQSNMVDIIIIGSPFRTTIDNKLETYNFN